MVAELIAEAEALPCTEDTEASLKKLRGCLLQAHLGPICFDGDPYSAKVVALQANPSYGDGATRGSHYQPHLDWPLSVVGPHVEPATLKRYRGIFKNLVDEGISIEHISRHVLKVELSPWASKKWPSKIDKLQDALRALPSRQSLVAFVRALMRTDAVFMMVRGWNDWYVDIPELADLHGTRVFHSKVALLSGISPGMYPAGWPHFVEALKAR